MTPTEVASLKRTELQAAACRQFGKSAAGWTGRATNEELREALMSGEVPAKFLTRAGRTWPQFSPPPSTPLLQAQLDEARVMELIEARLAELATFVEATLIGALERAGIRVQVDMLSLATNGAGREVRIAARLKKAGEVIQLDKLAFCLAHPALHRKLNFSLRLKHAGWIGGSIDVPLDQRGDIYIDAADTTAAGCGSIRKRRRSGCWRSSRRRGSPCGPHSRKWCLTEVEDEHERPA